HGFVAVVVPGGLVWVAGMLWYSQRVGVQPAWVSQWLPGSIITGVGAGLVLPSLGAAGIASTPGAGYAIAGALNTTARQIGGALTPREMSVATGDGITAFLRSVPIFSGLSQALQERIAEIAEPVTLAAGEFVFHRDDPVDGLYVVRAGRLEVILETPGDTVAT